MKNRFCSFLALFIFSFGFTQEKVKLLMIGNSFTFYYNLPMTIEQFSKYKGLNWEVHQSTAGGASFKHHWNSEKGLNSVDKIKNNKYTHLIFQEYSNYPLVAIDTTQKYLNLMHKIANHNSRKFLYATWSYPNILKNNNSSTPSSKAIEDKLRKIKPSSGHACLYVGFEQTAQELNIKDTNLWIYPSYDHDLNTSNYLHDENSEFPLVYISFASAKDPTWEDNHGNTATLEAIVPTNFNNYTQWQDKPWKKRGSDYNQFKQEFSNRIFEKIYKHVPQLKDKISFSELSTPLSTKSMSFYDNGELYGIDYTPQRFRQKWIKVKTPLRYFYMTGQDITTVGIPSALASGALTASVVLKKNLFKTI